MHRPAGLVLLLLALLLPLQGFAFASACETAATLSAAEHCAGHPDAPVLHGHHHECGTCCCVALATAPAMTPAGRGVTAADLPAPARAAHPTLLLDRLDRPPRA